MTTPCVSDRDSIEQFLEASLDWTPLRGFAVGLSEHAAIFLEPYQINDMPVSKPT